MDLGRCGPLGVHWLLEGGGEEHHNGKSLSETLVCGEPSERVWVHQELRVSCPVLSLTSRHFPLRQPSLLPQPWHFTQPPHGHTGQPAALPSPRAPGAADSLGGPPSYSEASRHL